MVWDDESESIEERRASLSKYSGAVEAANAEGETKNDPPANREEGGGDAR